MSFTGATLFLHPKLNTPSLRAISWLLSAAAGGVLVGVQTPSTVAALLAGITLLVCAAITPLSAVVVLTVLAPMRTLIATESPSQFPIDIGQIALAALLSAWLIARVARSQPLLITRPSPVKFALLIFIIAAGLTAFHAPSLTSWLTEWLKWVQILILVGIVADLGQSHCWEWIVFALVTAGVANALIGIYQYFGGSGALHLVVNDRFFRAFGTFGQPNPFGGFMGLLLPLSAGAATGYLSLFWRKRSRSRSALLLCGFYGLALPIQLAAIIMSWSRGAWLGLAAAAIACAVALPQRSDRRLSALAAVTGIVTAVWLFNLLPPAIVDRITSPAQEFFAFDDMRGVDITPENYAVVERLAHWHAAIQMFEASPWIGVGFGNFSQVYDAYRLLNWPEPLGHAHNYYLNLLAESGIIGLLAYSKVWLIIVVTSWRARRHPDPLARFIAVGLIGSWAYLTVHHVFDNLYVNNLFLHLGLMLGVLEVLYGQTHRFIRLDGL